MTEVLNQSADIAASKGWIMSKLPENWHETNGLWYTYYITALAECGLSYEDIPPDCLKKAIDGLYTVFDCNCGDFMLLRALVKLGVCDDETVKASIAKAAGYALPDGGFLCRHRVEKLKYTPKSCYKANLHALLLAAECRKRNIECPYTDTLIQYFKNHNVFYRTDNREVLVLNARPGWRTIDTFYPFEVMRVGLQNVVEAFSALGFGNEPWLAEAWDILSGYKDDCARVVLKGTLTKSYLPKERVGKPSKWVTFYTLLAEKERNQCRR
ncbi:MAG: hypothetical protein VB111_06290 [Clostridiaceae bacterium]|nr:hypothetical protein [Clostridiaceae bacterium]